MAPKNEALEALSARFDVKDVKQRTQGGRQLDYISIDSTIRRLNEVLGVEWSTAFVAPPTLTDTGNGFLAVVALELSALNKSAVGIGADKAPDPDKALKTALAEALKKAGHQFGVGLYLWDEGERQVVARDRKAAGGDLGALKAQVFEIALDGGAKPTAEGVAEFLNVPVTDLQNIDALKSILANRK